MKDVSVPSAPTPLSGVGALHPNRILIPTELLNILNYIHENYQRIPVESTQNKASGTSSVTVEGSYKGEFPGDLLG